MTQACEAGRVITCFRSTPRSGRNALRETIKTEPLKSSERLYYDIDDLVGNYDEFLEGVNADPELELPIG